jgi:hypothetical protein
MRQTIRTLLLLAATSAAPLVAGCTMNDESPYGPAVARPARDPAYSRPLDPARLQSPVDINMPSAQPAQAAGQPPAPQDQGLGSPPVADTTGVKFAELPAVRQAIEGAKPWQQAESQAAEKIDAPDLKQNLHDGMAALAPRLARALIDHRGDVAIVTVAIYRDTRPATQPANPTATQPVYKDAAIAIAFEGFGGRLDSTFLPRVLSDQPRTPDDGREPVDPNLALDRGATSYLVFKLTRDGLQAGVVGHDELRPQVADAVATLPPPATRPETGPATRPGDLADGVQPGPALPQNGGGYDDGGYYGRDIPRAHGYDPSVYGPYATGGAYGAYAYGGPSYGGASYWGPVYDPYLYDLYGCSWNSGFFVGGGGRYYGSGPWIADHHGWRDRGDHSGRPNQPTAGGVTSTRGRAPWQRPPIVSPVNPPGAVAASPGNRSRGSVTGSVARPTAATPTAMDIPASGSDRAQATAARAAAVRGSSAAGSTAAKPDVTNSSKSAAADNGRVTYRPSFGPSITFVPSDRPPSDATGAQSTGWRLPMTGGPRIYAPSSDTGSRGSSVDRSPSTDSGPRVFGPSSGNMSSRSDFSGPTVSRSDSGSSARGAGGDGGASHSSVGSSSSGSGSSHSSGGGGGSSGGGGSGRGR